MSGFRLILTFENKRTGENYHRAIDLDDRIAGEFWEIPPPSSFLFSEGFAATVTRIKKRVFRKEQFAEEAKRLGVLLAEHMEDKEGWHGEHRAEIIAQQRAKQ